jgi:hypothetical protein
MFGLILFTSCDKTKYDTQSSTKVPRVPFPVHPLDSAINVEIDDSIYWGATHPEGDLLRYDLYLGTIEDPPLVQSSLNAGYYFKDTLETSTRYYWRIVARDGHKHTTSGPVWTFITTDKLPPYTP